MSETALSTAARQTVLDRLERERFGCVVIGGGISGAGVARHAAQRGLSVALLEADDFAAGTSSRSSKPVHGGLRYLALGEIGLVRRTALERKEIFRLAPHLAERRWVVVPARSRAGMMKMRVGIATYEKLGAVEAEDAHGTWDVEELARHEPALDRSVFRNACLVGEFGVSPECAARLARLYGSEARDLARSGTQPLVAGTPVLAAEVDWAVGVTAAATLEDVVYRRLRSAWFVPGAREESVVPSAERMASQLGWDGERTRAEIDAVRARLAADLAFLAESRP